MSGEERPPRWLTESCPSWCVRRHAEGDHPDDRSHVSAAVEVPALERVPAAMPRGPSRQVRTATLQIGLVRPVGDPETWVYLGDGEERGIEILQMSARMLGLALADLTGQ